MTWCRRCLFPVDLAIRRPKQEVTTDDSLVESQYGRATSSPPEGPRGLQLCLQVEARCPGTQDSRIRGPIQLKIQINDPERRFRR